MAMFLEIAFLCVLGSLTRAIFLCPGGRNDGDVLAHLWLIQLRQRRRLGQPEVANSLVAGYTGYPPMPHALLACLDRRYWAAAGRMLNIAYEVVGITAIVVMGRLLLPPAWAGSNAAFSPTAVLGLLFATSPLLHPVTARLQAIGGRTLGPVLMLLYFSCLGAAYVLGNPIYYIPCILVGLAVFMSSQFGMQVLVTTSVGLSIAYLHWAPLALLAVIVAIGLMIPQLDLARLLIGKLAHYRWYWRNLDRVSIARRNRVRDIICLPYYLAFQPRLFFEIVFYRSTVVTLLYSAVPLAILGFWFATEPEVARQVWQDPVSRFGILLTAVGLVCALATATGKMRIFGESERYIEYMLAPILFVFVQFSLALDVSQELMISLALFQIGVVLVHFLCVATVSGDLQRQMQTCGDPKLQAVARFFKDRDVEHKIVTIPTKLSCALAVAIDDDRFRFYYDFMCEPQRGMQYMEEDCPQYGYIRPELQHFSARYGADTVVVDKGAATRAGQKGIRYQFDQYELLHEDETYVVYNIRTSTAVSTPQPGIDVSRAALRKEAA